MYNNDIENQFKLQTPIKKKKTLSGFFICFFSKSGKVNNPVVVYPFRLLKLNYISCD